MEKKRIRDIRWYLFTDDAYTNESISRELPPENTSYNTSCSDGKKRDLWVCDGQFVTKMLKNKKSQKFIFDVYKREGSHGPIIRCDFFKAKKSLTRI